MKNLITHMHSDTYVMRCKKILKWLVVLKYLLLHLNNAFSINLKPTWLWLSFEDFLALFIDLIVLMQHLLRVIPVIGILTNNKEFHPCPNPAEVEAVFDAPLEMFLKVCIKIHKLVSLSRTTYTKLYCYLGQTCGF